MTTSMGLIERVRKMLGMGGDSPATSPPSDPEPVSPAEDSDARSSTPETPVVPPTGSG
jgi:hypothetical protein